MLSPHNLSSEISARVAIMDIYDTNGKISATMLGVEVSLIVLAIAVVSLRLYSRISVDRKSVV